MPTSTNKSLLELEVEMIGWDTAASTAADLDTTLSDLERGVDIEVTLDAPDVGVLDDLSDTDISVPLEVEESEETKGILEGVNFLVALEKIKLAIEIVGSIWEIMGSLQTQFVDPFLDVEDAVARINAQTGTNIPDLDQLIRDLQAADLGDSVEQIADVVIHAQQIGAPMREAAEAALTFTHTFDENPETVLTTLNSLVETGLVPNLQEAADLMTVFFQEGGNVGGDALSVVNANAQAWADMELSAAEALSVIDSLQQGTGATATDAAKMLLTLDDAFTIAAADPASQQAQMLNLLKIDNPKETGEAIGAETIDGFAAAFANVPSDQQDLMSGLFLGKGGKKFTGAIEGMTTQSGIFADVVGAAELAAGEIDNSLRGAIDDFVLEINTSVARLLSSDELDLPGKIADLKEAFQRAATTLAEGGSIGDALSVGFHIEGVDTALTNVERVFGQMVISLLEIVATIQDPTGLGDADKGTRAEIARLATNQLPFDIKIANPEELDGILNQALNRGVDIGAGLRTAMDELVASGEFEQVRGILAEIIADPATTAEAAAALVSEFNAKIDEQMAASAPPAESDGWWNRLKPPSDLTDTKAFSGPEGAGAKGTNWWETISVSPETIESLDAADEAVVTLDADVNTAMTNAQLVTGLASASMIENMAAITDGVTTADEQIAMAITGNTMTASFDAMSVSAATNAESTKASFMSVLATVSLVDSRMSDFFYSVMAKVGAANAAIEGIGTVPSGTGGGGGTTNNTNITVTNNTSTQSPSEAEGLGYRFAAQIRGMV